MRLKLTIQRQLPCDPFLTNNCSMTYNSIEKIGVLNVKLEVKLRFKTCYLLLSP